MTPEKMGDAGTVMFMLTGFLFLLVTVDAIVTLIEKEMRLQKNRALRRSRHEPIP